MRSLNEWVARNHVSKYIEFEYSIRCFGNDRYSRLYFHLVIRDLLIESKLIPIVQK